MKTTIVNTEANLKAIAKKVGGKAWIKSDKSRIYVNGGNNYHYDGKWYFEVYDDGTWEGKCYLEKGYHNANREEYVAKNIKVMEENFSNAIAELAEEGKSVAAEVQVAPPVAEIVAEPVTKEMIKSAWIKYRLAMRETMKAFRAIPFKKDVDAGKASLELYNEMYKLHDEAYAKEHEALSNYVKLINPEPASTQNAADAAEKAEISKSAFTPEEDICARNVPFQNVNFGAMGAKNYEYPSNFYQGCGSYYLAICNGRVVASLNFTHNLEKYDDEAKDTLKEAVAANADKFDGRVEVIPANGSGTTFFARSQAAAESLGLKTKVYYTPVTGSRRRHKNVELMLEDKQTTPVEVKQY